eukprot:663370-Prymnesium_polylepis.1
MRWCGTRGGVAHAVGGTQGGAAHAAWRCPRERDGARPRANAPTRRTTPASRVGAAASAVASRVRSGGHGRRGGGAKG